MLKLLPRLPFMCAFDILFRHGGLASGLQRIFPGVRLFEFLKQIFGTNLWTEIVCACHLVFSLQHPADALFLLHPVDKTIPESVGAWSVSSDHSDAPWILPVRRDLMIRAMRAFLPWGGIYDWLDATDLIVERSTQGWVEFAGECINAHRFTSRWWKKQEGITWWEHDTMGHAILNVAKEERARLETALVRKERMHLLSEKRTKREMKLEGQEKPVKLTQQEEASAKTDAGQQYIKHRNIIKEVKRVLNHKPPTRGFDASFPEVARLVIALAKKYRKMRWTLKAIFHDAAETRLGLGVWHIERELCRQESFTVKDLVEKWRRLC